MPRVAAPLRAGEHVARAVGAVAAGCAVALVVLLRARTEDDPDAEALGDLLGFVLLAPAVALLCVAATACLLVALVRARGRLRPLTWLLALPGALAGAAVCGWAVSGAGLDLGWLLEG